MHIHILVCDMYIYEICVYVYTHRYTHRYTLYRHSCQQRGPTVNPVSQRTLIIGIQNSLLCYSIFPLDHPTFQSEICVHPPTLLLEPEDLALPRGLGTQWGRTTLVVATSLIANSISHSTPCFPVHPSFMLLLFYAHCFLFHYLFYCFITLLLLYLHIFSFPFLLL